jgi:hypothetical protein
MRLMRRLTLVLVLTAAVAVPAGTAQAGGWATVEVAPPPAGIAAGDEWRAELLIKQHGITPLDGLEPSVEITDGAGAVRSFRARPAGRPGTYVADVTYPSAGTWNTRFYDGFTNATPHRLAPLTVAPAGGAPATLASERPASEPAPAAGGGGPSPQAVAVALVALLWAAGCIAAWRSSRPRRYLPTS